MKTELPKTVEHHRQLMNMAFDGAAVLYNGLIIETNMALADLVDLRPEKLINKKFEALLASQLPNSARTILKGTNGDIKGYRQSEPFIAHLKTPNGPRPVKIQLCSQGKPKSITVLMTVRDLADQLQAEKELLEARKLESIAALSGGIAHDYNNILTAVMGNITLAQSQVEASSKLHGYLNQAYQASLVAKELTQKLATFAKGGQPLKHPVRVAKLIRTAVEFTLSGSNVKSVFKLPRNLWTVTIDEDQISQAIHNLIINNREAMPEGGTLRVSAENREIKEERPQLLPGKYVVIAITDTGSGIPLHNLNRVFDPYFSTKDKGVQKGMGLGMSICQSIIKRHDGEIVVSSEPSKGTTYTIFLPATKEKPARKPIARTKPAAPDSQVPLSGKGHILVMDDEEMIRNLAGNILGHLGYDVGFAEDGRQAVDMYQQAIKDGQPFDAVILDLTVRGSMGGKEAIEQLLKVDPKVKAIVSSGYSENMVLKDYARYGFRGVVAKPYSISELSLTLKEVLVEA